MSRHSTVVIVVCCLVLLVHQGVMKTFNECELVHELWRMGFPEDQLEKWVCIIEAESSMKTDVIGGPDSDGSYDYGLFQINDRYWCSAGNEPGKGCNIRCSDLLFDDITEASQCAMKIYSQQGFGAWVGWKKCKGRQLSKHNC